MKFSLRTDTLAFQLSRPGVVSRSLADIPASVVAGRISDFRKAKDVSAFFGAAPATGACPVMGHPEHDAITFYMLQHAVAVIRQRVSVYAPLGDFLPILNTYHQWLAILSARMFYYLLLICTRESRHVHNNLTDSTFSALRDKYGQGCIDFNKSIKGKGSDEAADMLTESPPNATLGNYTAYLTDNFNKGQYSGGFGGKAWGKVAEVLRDFVHGTLTAEMMMDTSFTLCHNNGPIFNKGMLFHSYTHRIYKILDVQRSGQIPQLVGSSGVKEFGQHNGMLYAQCREVLEDAFTGYVDWFMVEELGALKSYTDEQKQQVALHGHPPKYKAKQAAKDLQAQIAKQQAAKEAALTVMIHPGCYVKKLEVTR